MKLKPLKSIQVANYELSRIFEFVKEFVNQLYAPTFLKGEEYKVAVTTSGTRIEHKLGVVPDGWIITDINSSANVWRTSWDDKFVTFQSSSNTMIKIWIY